MSWLSQSIGFLTGSTTQNQRAAAINAIGGRAMSDFAELGQQYQDQFGQMIESYAADRASNIGLYREEMDRARTDFTKGFNTAISQYTGGMDQAIREYRVGRDSTIALLRQSFEKQASTQTARNAFTGLGSTSFGQQSVQAIRTQGALQEGAVREQYSQGLSALTASRAQGRSTMTAQMAQGLGTLGQNRANNLAQIYQSYSANIARMREQGIVGRFSLTTTGKQMGYQSMGVSAANTTSSLGGLSGIASSALGSLIGTL